MPWQNWYLAIFASKAIGDSQQIKPTWSCMLSFCGGIQWCWGTHSEKQHLEKSEKNNMWFNLSNYPELWFPTPVYKKIHVESSISSSLIRQLIWKESVLFQFASLLGAPRCSPNLIQGTPGSDWHSAAWARNETSNRRPRGRRNRPRSYFA